MRSLQFFIATLLLLCLVGCQQQSASLLQGRWEGRPDSAKLRAVREAEKYGDEPNISTEEGSAEEGSATKSYESAPVTDWEEYEVSILFDFVSSDRLEMSLDGEQPRSGSWKIVSSSPVGCTIEVQTEPEGEDARVVRRQFQLLFDDREGTCVGFLLTEVGADRQQGAIYFRRPGNLQEN